MGCDRVDREGFCDECLSLLEWLDPSTSCSRCGAPIASEALLRGGKCAACIRRPPRYTQAVAALRYTGPLARSIVLWKYEGQQAFSTHFAGLLCDWTSGSAPKWWEKIQAIVPAPLHPRTFRSRGFSPPEELAEPLADAFAIPYLPRTLYKVRHTLPQARLDRETRIVNLSMSMQVFDCSLVEGRTIAVVDDVMTTGATVDECARALITAGADKVYGLVLARQSECDS